MNTNEPLVMVIEDEEMLLAAITKKLQLAGLKVMSSMSGKQAVENLKKMQTPPDAIWLDYYLRDMNGLELMQELKKDEKLANIPVVVVSNSVNSENVHNMLALGVKKYMLKAEYRLDDIIAIIKDSIAESKLQETNK